LAILGVTLLVVGFFLTQWLNHHSGSGNAVATDGVSHWKLGFLIAAIVVVVVARFWGDKLSVVSYPTLFIGALLLILTASAFIGKDARLGIIDGFTDWVPTNVRGWFIPDSAKTDNHDHSYQTAAGGASAPQITSGTFTAVPGDTSIICASGEWISFPSNGDTLEIHPGPMSGKYIAFDWLPGRPSALKRWKPGDEIGGFCAVSKDTGTVIITYTLTPPNRKIAFR
jgi:hypothetical protein